MKQWSVLTVASIALLASCGDDSAQNSGGGTTGGIDSLGTGTGLPSTTGSDGTMGATATTLPTGSTTDTTTGTDGDSSTSGDGDDSSSSSTGVGSCVASTDCGPEHACVGEICVPTDGECETHDDCTGDTYCCDVDCLPPEEEGNGVCIPYGFDPLGDTNDECIADIVIGLFEPNVQCEWLAPEEDEPFPGHANVLTTPLVAQLPNNSGAAGEIVIVTYNGSDGSSPSSWGSDPNLFGVIRILNGQTCALLETIDDPLHRIIAASPPAIGDLDGDGVPEIVTNTAVSGLIAYTWNAGDGAFETMWTTGATAVASANRWDGPAIHDVDGDGLPEVLSGSEVFAGANGQALNPGQLFGYDSPGVFAIAGDVDNDGSIELISDDVYTWDPITSRWVFEYPGGPDGRHFAYADFGTPGMTAAEFDPFTLDGVAEIVTVAPNVVSLSTLGGQLLMSAGVNGGGPPTIGDFDNDGFPEISSAGGTAYIVYDLDCEVAGPGCVGGFVRWSRSSQDASSSNTGSSIFDFEGDGQAEAVYGDECFVRVYEGGTGGVLYSAARTSCTWYENPIVADPDFDDNTEILVGSNTNCNVSCPLVDPIHEGVRCEDDDDCPAGCDQGFCRCAGDLECPGGHQCVTPLPVTPGLGDVCRAVHPVGAALSGVRVLRDALDRWASSRPLWNQHAYSINNINDNLSIPAVWTQNFLDPELNNFRQNRQGDVGAADLPDITGKLEEGACVTGEEGATLTGTVCNRGVGTVGAALPATFYLGDPADGNILCVAYTAMPVPLGQCLEVSCDIPAAVTGLVTMVTNDDGMGGALTVECFENNNSDTIDLDACPKPG